MQMRIPWHFPARSAPTLGDAAGGRCGRCPNLTLHPSVADWNTCAVHWMVQPRPPRPLDAHSMVNSGSVGAQPRSYSRWAMRPLPKIDIAALSCRLKHLRSALDGSAPTPPPPRCAIHGDFWLSRRPGSGRLRLTATVSTQNSFGSTLLHIGTSGLGTSPHGPPPPPPHPQMRIP